MKCPHCTTSIHEAVRYFPLANDCDGSWLLKSVSCPECKRNTLWLINGEPAHAQPNNQIVAVRNMKSEALVRPKTAMRPPSPPEVPQHLAKDYNEACIVIGDSTKASAALSRRCLQTLLREAANVKPSDLSREIQEVLSSGKLPSYLAEDIDAVRNIGNFAAHPMKAEHSGEILDVEPGEAEWNLEVLESLFDFYYVQPSKAKARRAALDAKLSSAGKPPMK